MADSTFRAGGLSTGMDTNSIIDQLTALESQPITNLQKKQSNLKVQVSALADLIIKLKALGTSAADLGTNGVFATKTTSSNTAFTASPGSAAAPGRYSVEVQSLATAARWRSAGFASGTSLASGTLSLTVQGKTYPTGSSSPITIASTDTVTDVAYKIRKSGAPVSAVALTDADGLTYLSITSLATGQPLDNSTDLSLAFTPDDVTPGVDVSTGATLTHGTNASVYVDGLHFVRTTNSTSDVIPGVNLTLNKQAPGTPEDLVVATDPSATQARLQKFVDAYNGVMTLVQRQLNVNKDTDRERSLAGDGAVRDLQSKLQKLIVSKVSGLGGVRTLADVGLKTNRDGSLAIDSSRLSTALTTDPAAVNALFSTAGSGLSDAVDALVKAETQTVSVAGRTEQGLLLADQARLNRSITDIDGQVAKMQLRIDAFKKNLVSQFTSMENTVGSLKSIGTYLNSTFTKTSSS